MATKTILITGATDGIGRETAKALVADGHHVIAHGRSVAKLEALAAEVQVDVEVADLARFDEVEALAERVLARGQLDVLINNAGVFKMSSPRTESGMDARFVVNTLAPFVLTERLWSLLSPGGRVVNVSSAAQAPVNLDALAGRAPLDDMAAYAQSKLAITLWTRELARTRPDGPTLVSVNPGSYLASKMVKEAFGVAGHDLAIGVNALRRTALDEAVAARSGAYFDNDAGRFAEPHEAALDAAHASAVMAGIAAAIDAWRRASVASS
ncbi:MAG: SDR family NAD(P)-dependent oxidoreductase [Myxococcota bacterium]